MTSCDVTDYHTLRGILWEWPAPGCPIHSYRFFLYNKEHLYIINYTEFIREIECNDSEKSSNDSNFNNFNVRWIPISDDFDLHPYIDKNTFIPDSLEDFHDLQGGDIYDMDLSGVKLTWSKFKKIVMSFYEGEGTFSLDASRCGEYALLEEKLKEICSYDHLHFHGNFMDPVCSKTLCDDNRCGTIKTPVSKYCCCHFIENKIKNDPYHCCYCGEIPYCFKVLWLLKTRKLIVPDIYRSLLKYMKKAYDSHYYYLPTGTRCENCISTAIDITTDHVHWPGIKMKGRKNEKFENIWKQNFGRRTEITFREAKLNFPSIDFYFNNVTIKKYQCLFACTGIANKKFRRTTNYKNL